MAERVTTKEALKKLDEQLECSICLDTFKQPKLLPCFHVFCKSPCLEKLVAKDGHSLTCPTCRHIVPLSEKGVAGLQSDFHIDRLFEIRDTFGKISESSKTQCGNCGDGKATRYCQDCEQFLCENCEHSHKSLTRHQLVSCHGLDLQTTNSLPRKRVPHCPKHPDNALKIYCDTCSVLICIDCTVRIHQGHNYDLVAEVLPQHKEELVSSLKPIKKWLGDVQEVLSSYETLAKEINDQRATLEANIHKEIGKQHQLLDQRRAELMDRLDMLTQQRLERLAAQRNPVEVTKMELVSCLEYAEGGLQRDTGAEILEMKAPVLERIKQVSREYKDPLTMKPQREATMILITEGKEQLQSCYKNFLHIEHSESFSHENSYAIGDGLRGATSGEQKTVTFQAMTKDNRRFRGDFNLTAVLVSLNNKAKIECVDIEKQNGLHDIIYQPLNRGMHLLQFAVNGHPVRGSPFPIAVAPSPQSLGKPVRVIQGLSYPRGTAVNSKGEIVVMEGGNSVSVLTPQGEKIRTFTPKAPGKGLLGNAWGVAVDASDNIYVADGSSNRIQKFNSKGEFVAAVGSKGSGKHRFDGAIDICYNKRSNYLFVPDQNNHRVKVLTTDLKFVHSFETRESKNAVPYNIALDNTCNIYVTDRVNGCVQVYTEKGQFLRAFSQKANGQTLIKPWAIAIDSANTVYVSEAGPHSLSVFTSQGDYITTFGCYGSANGQMNGIHGLSVDHDDSIIVSDCINGRLQIF